MKTVDTYLTELDQDLADAAKAFRDAERLLQRGRRRLVALMGAARVLGLRRNEPHVNCRCTVDPALVMRRKPGRAFQGKRYEVKKED